MSLNRNSVGYEINKNYLPVIKEKLGADGLFDHLELVLQEEKQVDHKKEILKLPYVFKDPVKFDKKIDPKKLRFGSKIDHADHQREAYYSVKEIISPETLVLDNGLKVRLLGVKENKELNGKATAFLAEKLKGQKVFMKFDKEKYDKEGNLLCYLYLKNKTFINAHVIKSKLSDVDTSMNYRYKSKFIGIREKA